MPVFIAPLRSFIQAAVRRNRFSRFPFPHPRYQSNKAGHGGAATKILTPVDRSDHVVALRQRLGLIARPIEAFAKSQRERPYTTQFLCALVIYFVGDLSAQKINGDEYDLQRALHALAIGAGSSIPTYQWLLFLGNHFNYRSRLLSLATKIVINQSVFTPLIHMWIFGMYSLLAGNALVDIWEHIKRTVPTSVANSCMFWPAMTAFNFTFVQAQYRCVFVGMVSIGWQTYLSYLNRKSEALEAHNRQTRL